MKSNAKLQALYAAIPAFDCKPGCSDCCGPVPMAKPEWQAVKMAKRAAGADCLSCVYLVDGKCSVYADRPYMCRLFGATVEAKLACPHGCGPDKPLNAKQTAILTKRYMAIVGDAPAAFTCDLPASLL